MPGVGVDLGAFLNEFVAARRGLRAGRMFGAPAAYAGRKMFACAYEHGVICKLPTDLLRDQIKTGRAAPFEARGRTMTGWVMYHPATLAAARRLEPTLEAAARFVADTQFSTPIPTARPLRSRRPR